jgi:hypothetical protein
MKCRIAFFVFLLILGASMGASAASIVGNGSFETPSLTAGTAVGDPTGAGVDWTFSGEGAGIESNGGVYAFTAAPDGVQVAYMQFANSISQTVNLTPGDDYTLTYYLEQRSSYSAWLPIVVSVGGSTVDDITSSPGTTAWILYTDAFTAGSSSELLAFTGSDPTGADEAAGLDDATITLVGGSPTSAVPEPGTIALLGSGLLGLAGMVRRKFGKNA